MASVAGPRPACGVHLSGPSSGAWLSAPSGVQSPGFVVGDPAVRPSAVHPSNVRPSAVHPSNVRPSAVRPVRPDTSAWSPSGVASGNRPTRQGNQHHGKGSRSRWAAASESRMVGGAVAGGPGRVGCEPWPRLTLAPGQARPACGAACRRGCARAREQAAARGCRACRVAADSALSCRDGWWACQDLNLGPHPYQVSRAKRCAERRFPRSPLSVRGEGMRS
jgi:hypothetical protein